LFNTHQIILNQIKRKGYITDQEYSNLTNRAKAKKTILAYLNNISAGINRANKETI